MLRLPSLIAALVLCLVSARVNFRGSGQFGQAQVETLLSEELADKHQRLALYEDEMRQMYGALPKNEFGNLGHDALRSSLHRFFVKRHGWYLHGLEPGTLVDVPENQVVLQDKDRLPLLLQETFERRTVGRGATLHDAAAMAAAVEDLIRGEVDAHLKDAYTAAEVPLDAQISYGGAYLVSKVYFMSYLLEHNWTVENHRDLDDKQQIFEAKYPLYNEAITWLNRTVEREIGTATDKPVDSKLVATVANKVGEEYHILNDGECADLRKTLQKMESRVPGRIRLSVFYNMSLHSHWKFNEKVETLRALGALDESNPNQPSVLISNYATAKPNCVNASNIYDICCRNTCEDLLTHLESEIGTSTSTVERITSIVAQLQSESVQAPRELPPALLRRLDEISAHHGGQVPLHGRLFAQWLHHAYPLECPYPHEAGVTNPQLWTGGESDQASEAEMKQHVDADTCAVTWEGKIDCGEESVELPWTAKEELLQSGIVIEGKTRGIWSMLRSVVGLLSLAAAVLLAWPQHSRGSTSNLRLDANLKRAGLQRWHIAVAALACTALCTGMLDPLVLGIASLGGFVAKFAVPRMGSLGEPSLKLPKHV